MRRLLWLASASLLAACSTAGTRSRPAAAIDPTAHVPAFALRPYEPFSRDAAVAIALREWRVFGQPVDDDPPGSRPPRGPEDKPEREQGLWQRVGEYWFLSQDASRPEAAWTGKHDAQGIAFAAAADGDFAWSAAFISYVMRSAGAVGRFPYSPAHHDYIDLGRQMVSGASHGWAMTTLPPDGYAAQPGDLICVSRTPRPLTYADLPAGDYPAHCDIVVQAQPGQLTVLGGNVDDAVTMKHVPTTADGLLAPPGGPVVDTRYPWLAVLKIGYDF